MVAARPDVRPSRRHAQQQKDQSLLQQSRHVPNDDGKPGPLRPRPTKLQCRYLLNPTYPGPRVQYTTKFRFSVGLSLNLAAGS
jgi:hypothetical protein